jgi:lipoprotein Spr
MKSLLTLIVSICAISVFAQGQSSSRPVLRFIEGIELSRDLQVEPRQDVAVNKDKTQPVSEVGRPHQHRTHSSHAAILNIEQLSQLQFKYAMITDREVEAICNLPLYRFIEEWMDTPYRLGGNSKDGIDCSGFSGTLMTSVYSSRLPRTAREQYAATERVERDELMEGDLVFFNNRGGVSHVGVYLGNNFFVHSSTKNGVIISSLNDTYYSRHYLGAGRNPQFSYPDAEAHR